MDLVRQYYPGSVVRATAFAITSLIVVDHLWEAHFNKTNKLFHNLDKSLPK